MERINTYPIELNRSITIDTYITDVIRYRSNPFYDIPDYKSLNDEEITKLIRRVARFWEIKLNDQEIYNVIYQLRH